MDDELLEKLSIEYNIDFKVLYETLNEALTELINNLHEISIAVIEWLEKLIEIVKKESEEKFPFIIALIILYEYEMKYREAIKKVEPP